MASLTNFHENVFPIWRVAFFVLLAENAFVLYPFCFRLSPFECLLPDNDLTINLLFPRCHHYKKCLHGSWFFLKFYHSQVLYLFWSRCRDVVSFWKSETVCSWKERENCTSSVLRHSTMKQHLWTFQILSDVNATILWVHWYWRVILSQIVHRLVLCFFRR